MICNLNYLRVFMEGVDAPSIFLFPINVHWHQYVQKTLLFP